MELSDFDLVEGSVGALREWRKKMGNPTNYQSVVSTKKLTNVVNVITSFWVKYKRKLNFNWEKKVKEMIRIVNWFYFHFHFYFSFYLLLIMFQISNFLRNIRILKSQVDKW